MDFFLFFLPSYLLVCAGDRGPGGWPEGDGEEVHNPAAGRGETQGEGSPT